MKQIITFLALLFFTISCSPETAQDSYSRDAVISEVRTMTDNFFNDINKEGFEAEFRYLDSTDDFFWVIPGSDQAIDYDSVYTILKQSAPDFDQIKFHWDQLNIYPLSSSIASYTGIVGGSMHQISTDSLWKIGLIESGVFIKRDDGWKFLCGQSRDN